MYLYIHIIRTHTDTHIIHICTHTHGCILSNSYRSINKMKVNTAFSEVACSVVI